MPTYQIVWNHVPEDHNLSLNDIDHTIVFWWKFPPKILLAHNSPLHISFGESPEFFVSQFGSQWRGVICFSLLKSFVFNPLGTGAWYLCLWSSVIPVSGISTLYFVTIMFQQVTVLDEKDIL